MSDRPTGPSHSAWTPPRVVAVLGPTNTGKTHLAVERMLGHASGMIGLPLRLLAREIYDRVAAARGPRSVALITGEEKIVPPRAQYFVCTVEAMPLGREVEFLAVDEVQLCADPERGHVFTQRLLGARGRYETMLLGAGGDGAAGPAAAAGGRDRHPRALFQAHLRGPEEDHPAAAPHRGGRLLGGRGLRDRRADPPPARRRGGGDGQPQPPHPQRAGGALPVRRGRLPGRHRRDRHGPQHGPRPRRVRRAREVRRQAHAAALRAGDRPDRRPRRPFPPRRHVRRHRRLRADGRGRGRASRGTPLRAGRPPLSGATTASISPRWPTCCARFPRQRRAKG